MSEVIPSPAPPIDLLRLFREDLNPEERIEAFNQARQLVADEIGTALDHEGLGERIGERFQINLVLNSHGDGIHAAQSLAEIDEPFITFVESAGAPETVEDPSFSKSVNNAFDMHFNAGSPQDSIFPLMPGREWHYYRDHGLLKRGSIIAPVDIRSYAYRLLDALMGQDYSQEFLNKRIGLVDLMGKSADQLTQEATNHGRLVMYSNALREHISVSQIVRTLRDVLVVERGETVYGEQLDERLRALVAKQDRKSDHLQVGVMYGSGHHMLLHLLNSFGLKANRVFAGKAEEHRPYAFIGSNLDAFFSGYRQEHDDEKIADLSRAYVLESLLSTVLTYGSEYGCMPESHGALRESWERISWAARKLSNPDDFERVIADFHRDKRTVVDILRLSGVKLRDL